MYVCKDCDKLFFDDERETKVPRGPVFKLCCRSTLCLKCADTHEIRVHQAEFVIGSDGKRYNIGDPNIPG